MKDEEREGGREGGNKGGLKEDCSVWQEIGNGRKEVRKVSGEW